MGFPFSVRRLAPWLFVLPLLALGCDRAGQSPTEPASSSPKIAAASSAATGSAATGGTVADKARGGNGGGNGGNGNGGGGNGHGHGGDLSFQIDPATWNTN
ncbi:MAG: hypothetical protein ACJ76N_13490, partial [Thermoanaerobaculia bacterium]